MRFWCAVSDRCSGKIGEGKVPAARSSCVYTLCCGTKGPCHSRHDWCSCKRIVRAYLHETLVLGPVRAGRFCFTIICPAHATDPTQQTTSNRSTSYVIKPVYISGNDSRRCPGLRDTTPDVLPHRHHCRTCASEGDHTAPNISARHLSLMFVSSVWCFELLMTSDVLRRNHIIVLDNEEH